LLFCYLVFAKNKGVHVAPLWTQRAGVNPMGRSTRVRTSRHAGPHTSSCRECSQEAVFLVALVEGRQSFPLCPYYESAEGSLLRAGAIESPPTPNTSPPPFPLSPQATTPTRTRGDTKTHTPNHHAHDSSGRISPLCLRRTQHTGAESPRHTSSLPFPQTRCWMILCATFWFAWV